MLNCDNLRQATHNIPKIGLHMPVPHFATLIQPPFELVKGELAINDFRQQILLQTSQLGRFCADGSFHRFFPS
jgi:hypothetical protein